MRQEDTFAHGFSYFAKIVLLWGVLWLTAEMAYGNGNEYIVEGRDWKAFIRTSDATIDRYEFIEQGEWKTIPFRKDRMAGPAWEGVMLAPDKKNPGSFIGEKDFIAYRITYLPSPDHLIVKCTMTNFGETPFYPERSRLIIGIDSEMHSYPQWDNKFFPTLLRCEKSFAWGYFMSPQQTIFGFATSEPAASYAINYIYEGWYKWKWGHQIRTASLEMLHTLPLPERHPQQLTGLLPGESRSWNIHMGPISSLAHVKPTLSEWADVPLMECSRYTLLPDEKFDIQIHSSEPIALSIIGPDLKKQDKSVQKTADNRYTADFSLHQKGEYKITATTPSGKCAEARVFVRQPWSWYMKNARDFVANNQPIFSNACETFYGYYTAFLAAKYFPDPNKDKALRQRFDRTLPLIIDTVTWTPNPAALPHRIQNFSALMGMLVDLWEATGERSYLDKAANIADYLCSDKIQGPDGAYRSKGTHYTAVIYTAKSMLELAAAERQLIDEPLWAERYNRHSTSAQKAIDDLCSRRDNIETEGDMTFEDGMISCSALQLGMCGLQTPDSSRKKEYTEAAKYLMDKHQCLEQLLIPDCRMRGATLRYWEALDVYFVPNQVMNSPHGWTAWKIYASYYLYLLTGEEFYLTDFMDTLGACAQIMREDGILRWGFIPDPYVKARLYVENPEKRHHGMEVDSIVGEQYLDMISPWLRPDDEDTICQFKERGGAGDNTVQEIFKVMEECALTSAYVLIRDDNSVTAYNCRVQEKNGTLHVTPNEAVISKIHVNTPRKTTITIHPEGQKALKRKVEGCQWIHLK